jgi:C-terminal processing protease CtpA/Prc
MYGETTAFEFKQELEKVKESGSSGLIIDVRDNGG